MKILFISHYYPPEMGGAAARIHGLARWLQAYGHNVSVITGFPSYPAGIVSEEYKGKYYAVEIIEGVQVHRVWSFTTSMQNGISRILNYFSFVLSALIIAMRLKGPHEIVIASSPPLFLGITGCFISIFKHIPLVFDVRDLWPDVAVESGIFSPHNPLIKMSRQLAKFIYKRSTKITPVTKTKYKKILSIIHDSEKIKVIPNGVDFDRLVSFENPNLRKRLGLDDKFIVSYTGLIGIAQGIGNIISAAEELKDNNAIHFLIVGEGVEKEKLKRNAQHLGLRNVTFLPSQPRENIPGILSEVNLVLVPLVSDQITDAVPSKLLEAWACEKPVILIAGGEAAELVQRADGGIVVDPKNPTSLASTIRSLSSKNIELNEYGRNGQVFVKENFNRKYLVKKLEKTLYSTLRRKD